jgi:hypothetical protein
MPISRDLMLAKAIDKYSNEMANLLGAIAHPDLRT